MTLGMCGFCLCQQLSVKQELSGAPATPPAKL
jgi:hypothetical protein